MIPRVVIREIRPHFEDATFDRGLVYANEGRVQLVKDDPWPVVAKVRGSEHYVVTVRQHGEALHGDCSCPVNLDCKHAAATALVALATAMEREPGRELAMRQDLVGRWLVSLSPRLAPSSTDEPTRNVILYVLGRSSGSIGLTIHKLTRRKRGGYTKGRSLVRLHEPHALPSWIPPEDLRRIALLRAISPGDYGSSEYSIGAIDAAVLEDLAGTGRLFWDNADVSPLSYGHRRHRPLEWRRVSDSGDEFRLGISERVEILPARDCHYVDLSSSTVGPLDLGVPAALVRPLIDGPPVPESMMPTVRQSLEPVLIGSEAAASLGPVESDADIPSLALHLRIVMDEDEPGGFAAYPEAHYGDDRFVLAEWDRSRALPRDLVVEGRWRGRMEELMKRLPSTYYDQDQRGLGQLAALKDLARLVLPSLASSGWTIDLPDEFPFEMAEVPSVWHETLRQTADGGSWFSFELGVRVGEQSVSLLPMLLEAIRREEISPEGLERDAKQRDYPGLNLELPDGRLVHVPGERVQRWVRPLIELRLRGLTGDDELWIPTHTAVAFEDDKVGRFGSGDEREAAHRHLQALVDLEPRREGRGFGGELRPYQRRGLAWLRFLHDGGYGGILADDLGLGKTVQLLAFLDGLRSARRLSKRSPALVVAPRSVVGQWRAEALRFSPKLCPVLHLGGDRPKDIDSLLAAPLIITSYQTLRRDVELLAEVKWASVIFDEAQFLKNPDTHLRKAAASLTAQSRFCVTGTPIENHLGELWSQMDLAMPGLLGRGKTFDAVIRRPVENHGATAPLEFLRQRIRPFMLRRDKRSIDLELPPKTEIVEVVALYDDQRDLYESLRLELDKDVRAALGKTGKGTSLVILDALLKLRQCCCDPRLVPLASARKVERSAKLERLRSMLEEVAESGRSALVFSQFTSMLELIDDECRAAGIETLKLTGATRNREKVVEAFQNGRAPVFLISLKAGGTGLNLTRADTVIHYDPWWNPAVEDQASDRAHRIGQDKAVFVYRLVAAGTVEERMLELKKDKRARADAVFAGGDATSLAKGDLAALYRELV